GPTGRSWRAIARAAFTILPHKGRGVRVRPLDGPAPRRWPGRREGRARGRPPPAHAPRHGSRARAWFPMLFRSAAPRARLLRGRDEHGARPTTEAQDGGASRGTRQAAGPFRGKGVAPARRPVGTYPLP